MLISETSETGISGMPAQAHCAIQDLSSNQQPNTPSGIRISTVRDTPGPGPARGRGNAEPAPRNNSLLYVERKRVVLELAV